MTTSMKAQAWRVNPRVDTVEIEMEEIDPFKKLKKLIAIQNRLNDEIRALNDEIVGAQNGS